MQSTAEPTAWAILALRNHEAATGQILTSATDWLRRTQLPEGAWATSSGVEPGCWVTAIACLALLKLGSPTDVTVARGLKWLCATWPAEGGIVWRLRQTWLRSTQAAVRQNSSLRGWSWTPGTASWVEPTAHAVIFLQNVSTEFYPPEASERIQLAERMLYDRACPGGGWNAGNPLVYGVPGVPRIAPTVWALLALRNHKERSVNQQSLEWLEQNYSKISGPGSLALAQFCLRVYGRFVPSVEPKLHEFYSHNQFLQSVPVLAWASLAVGGVPDWLESASRSNGDL